MALPETDAERILSIVGRVMSRYPKSALEDNMPLNEAHIMALFAAVCNREYQENNGIVEDEDLYIRILTALKISDRHIGERFASHGLVSTLQALERYKFRDGEGNNFYGKGWGVRGAVGNTAIRIIAATMPIVQPPSYDGRRSEKLYDLEKNLMNFKRIF